MQVQLSTLLHLLLLRCNAQQFNGLCELHKLKPNESDDDDDDEAGVARNWGEIKWNTSGACMMLTQLQIERHTE